MKKILILLIITVSLSSLANPVDLIGELGFHVTNSTPPPFVLNDLDGNAHNLEKWRGKWIILNFWATWCGPCRYEMPELQKLQGELANKDFQIIGISIDQGSKPAIKKFIKQNNINFPILWDQSGSVSREYVASSVPSLYLISPDFKLVGILRGAKSWSDQISTMARLLQYKKIPKDAIKKISASTASSPVPEKLIPPILEIKISDKNPVRGESAILNISIEWKGTPQKYIVKVPRLELPPEIEKGNVSVSSKATSKRATLVYHYPLSFMKEGNFHLGPVTLSYNSRAMGAEQFSRHPGIDLMVVKKSVPITILIIVGVVALLIIGIILKIALKKGKITSDKNGRELYSQFSLRYEDLRKSRIQGRNREYQKNLLIMLKELLLLEKKDVLSLDSVLEKISYGSETLSPQEINHYEKEIEDIIHPQSEEY
ncbi:MAG: TlpA family protein disulfide reductase [Bacteriovoracaceae bacterium]|nr:TlpA family protein disulfide reductase [Bacteriovoracaceae bacterium]